jgi:predicted DNA binding CopG/RHH family protein
MNPPNNPDGQKNKDRHVNLRLSSATYQDAVNYARTRGLSFSAWVRMVIMDTIYRPKRSKKEKE